MGFGIRYLYFLQKNGITSVRIPGKRAVLILPDFSAPQFPIAYARFKPGPAAVKLNPFRLLLPVEKRHTLPAMNHRRKGVAGGSVCGFHGTEGYGGSGDLVDLPVACKAPGSFSCLGTLIVVAEHHDCSGDGGGGIDRKSVV